MDDYVSDRERQLEAKVSQLQGIVAHQITTAQHQQRAALAERQFNAAVEPHEAQFRQTNPDYDQAITHLTRKSYQDLIDSGYSEQQATQAIVSHARQIAGQALQQGRNPAQAVYHLAKKAGYSASAARELSQDAIEQIDGHGSWRTSSGKRVYSEEQRYTSDPDAGPDSFDALLAEVGD